MNLIYNAAVSTMSGFMRLYSKGLRRKNCRKFSRFVRGQQGLIKEIRRHMAMADRTVPTVWFHCASLGEYGVARPLISSLKAKGPCNVVLTFFSPSGYEALQHRHPDIDYLFYLPLDTQRNARAFIDAVNPDRAVFMISEYWLNYLMQLKYRAIPTFLISAIIRDDAPFFKWYGKIYRRALWAFKHIFVLNNHSRFCLSVLGYEDVTVSGDALFDNAALVSRTDWHDDVISRFTSHGPTFIFGSVSDYNDMLMMERLIAENPDTRFLVVPHDVSADDICRVAEKTGPDTVLYSEVKDDTDLMSKHVMIVDCIGKLAYLYRYGTWAYVGGGFTPLLHSVIEATVYGLPVSFGPRIERKVTPQQLVELGIGEIVETPDKLVDWFAGLKNNPERLEKIKEQAENYVSHNEGATNAIVKRITEGLWAND